MNNTGKLVQVSMLGVIVMMGFMASMHSVAALNTNDVLPNLSGAASVSAGDGLSTSARVSVGDNNSGGDEQDKDNGSSNTGASTVDNTSDDQQESFDVTAADNTGGDNNDEENTSDNRTYISGGSGNESPTAVNATSYSNATNMSNMTNVTGSSDANYNDSNANDNESSEAGLSIEENERAQTGLLAEINARLSDIRSMLASIVARIGANNASNSTIDMNSTNGTNMTGYVNPPTVIEVNESVNATINNGTGSGSGNTAVDTDNDDDSNGNSSSTNTTTGNGSHYDNDSNSSMMESSVVGIQISRGVGWSMNEDGQASFTRFAASKQEFVDPDGQTGYSSGLAIMQLDGSDYGLVMDEQDSNDTSMVYRLAANDSGMLLLQQRFSAGNFATWQGTFTDGDGDTYNVGLVTMKRQIELAPSDETSNDSGSDLNIQGNSTAEFQEEFNRIASAEIMNQT